MITAENARKIVNKSLSKKVVNQTIDKIEQQIIECSRECIRSTRFDFDTIWSTTNLTCIVNELEKCGYDVYQVYNKYCFPEYVEAIIITW